MKPSDLSSRTLWAVFVVGMVNFTIYMLIGYKLGGDAVNGYATNGRYFLSNHGIHTETTHWIFIYSKVHTYSLFITHPLAILSVLVLNSRRSKKQNQHAA